MPKNPNAPRPADTFPLFHTTEPFKALSGRLGISPNTLRKWWVGEFGQEAFDARGKSIQAKAAAETGRATAGKPRTLPEVVEPCSSCSASVTLNVLQRARLKRILCLTCEGRERGADRYCPVCGLGCVGERGLSGHMARPQHGDPETHRAYLDAQAEVEWAGKQEGRDYLRCLICGHLGVRIDGHLRAEHGLSVEAYRAQFFGAEVQADALREARAEQARQTHQGAPRKGQTRTVPCSSCGIPRTVGLTFAPSTHETRCPDCVEAERPKAVPTIRSSPLKGRTLPPETKAKMAANAGRWNAGLTKDTDDRVAAQAEKMVGRTPWSKGLTKAEHPSLRATSEKLSRWSGEQRYWSNGLRADLSDVDFTPYLDETGAVDRRMMAEDLGLSEPTVTKYMESLGLRLSTKYLDARVARDTADGRFHEMSRVGNEPRIIRLTPEQLEPFKLKNGKVFLARAMVGLGHVQSIIKRECVRLGIPTHTHLVKQAICLEAVSRMLGNDPYEKEWRHTSFVNPLSGHRFKFDGFFPAVGPHGLLVEFQGYQHYVFPNVFHKTEADYKAGLERDAEKARQVLADGRFLYFLVREDDPYADEQYLRQRYLDLIE